MRMMLVEIGETSVSPTELTLPKPTAAQAQAPISPWQPPHNEPSTLLLLSLPPFTGDRQPGTMTGSHARTRPNQPPHTPTPSPPPCDSVSLTSRDSRSGPHQSLNPTLARPPALALTGRRSRSGTHQPLATPACTCSSSARVEMDSCVAHAWEARALSQHSQECAQAYLATRKPAHLQAHSSPLPGTCAQPWQTQCVDAHLPLSSPLIAYLRTLQPPPPISFPKTSPVCPEPGTAERRCVQHPSSHRTASSAAP